MDPKKHVLDGDPDPPRERVNLWVERFSKRPSRMFAFSAATADTFSARANLKQEAQLSPRDRATRRVS